MEKKTFKKVMLSGLLVGTCAIAAPVAISNSYNTISVKQDEPISLVADPAVSDPSAGGGSTAAPTTPSTPAAPSDPTTPSGPAAPTTPPTTTPSTPTPPTTTPDGGKDPVPGPDFYDRSKESWDDFTIYAVIIGVSMMVLVLIASIVLEIWYKKKKTKNEYLPDFD